MDHMTLKLADITLLGQQTDDKWECIVCDDHNGKKFRFQASADEFGSLVTLMMGMGENLLLDAETIEELYELVRPILVTCPKECYPIP